MGGIPNSLSPIVDGAVGTELNFKSRERDSERGIFNPAPEERERSPPLKGKTAGSCIANPGADAKMIAENNPTMSNFF
jgi:hypothetical protein